MPRGRAPAHKPQTRLRALRQTPLPGKLRGRVARHARRNPLRTVAPRVRRLGRARPCRIRPPAHARARSHAPKPKTEPPLGPDAGQEGAPGARGGAVLRGAGDGGPLRVAGRGAARGDLPPPGHGHAAARAAVRVPRLAHAARGAAPVAPPGAEGAALQRRRRAAADGLRRARLPAAARRGGRGTRGRRRKGRRRERNTSRRS